MLILAAPLAFAWLALRARRQTGAADALRERCGRISPLPDTQPVWIHAASMGEAQAAQSLIEWLLAREPRQAVLITTFSATAHQYCVKRYGNRAQVAALPYDVPWFVDRFLKRTNPQTAIFIETEIWPNLYHGLHRRGIPIVIASARLSERAFHRYQRIKTLIARCLGQATHIGAQTRGDADRFIALGAPAERVSVTGNLKFDTQIAADVNTRGEALRRDGFANASVWVAGSTREGEGPILLEAFGIVRKQYDDCVLVIAPRHPERAQEVARLAQGAGFSVSLYSDGHRPLNADVLVVDSVGHLLTFYAAADMVFVGGTLVDIGGHNILEPAMLGRAIVTGPHLENWRELASEMTAAGGMEIVADASELARAVNLCLSDEGYRARTGESAKACVERNRGALERTLAIMNAISGAQN